MNSWDSYVLRPTMTRWVRVLLVANLVLFVLQQVLSHFVGGLFDAVLALSWPGILRGWAWQVGTYMFLHAGVMHILVNLLTLYFIGPELERTMGARRFLSLYFLSGALGGLAWLLLAYPSSVGCVGASGAIFGLLGAFAALFPHRTITLLVFFVLPLTLRAWVLVSILALIQLLYLISPGGGHVAYSAHLAGVIVGFAYAMAVFRPGEAMAWLRSRRRRPKPQADAGPGQGDIDRILDKIAREGMQSLSQSERMILEKASQRRGR